MDDQPPEVTEAVEVSTLGERPDATSASVLATRRLLLTPRQRLRRLAVAGGSVLLALLILLAAVPGLRTGAGSWLVGLRRLHPLLRCHRAPIAFTSSRACPIFSLFIDGHAVSQLPRIGTDPPLVLARGQHRLSWNVAPFLPTKLPPVGAVRSERHLRHSPPRGRVHANRVRHGISGLAA